MIRVQNQVAALLDERAGERIVEDSLRQRQFDRRALAGLARDADCAQPHRHLGARPGMLGEVDSRAPVADAVGGRRQLQGRLRRRRQRARRWAGAFVRTGEVRPGARKPKPILRLVGERQRAAEVGAGVLGRDNRRSAGRGDGEDGDRRGLAAAQDRRLAGAHGWSTAFRLERSRLKRSRARRSQKWQFSVRRGARRRFVLLFRRRDRLPRRACRQRLDRRAPPEPNLPGRSASADRRS